MCVYALLYFLHSEVSVDITRQGFSVENKGVANNVECEAGAPVGNWVISCGSGSCCSVTFTFLLLGFFFLTLCDHIDKEHVLSNEMPD